MMKTKPDRDVLLEEFRNSFQHYRHLENTRSKYMNFFFSILFSILGVYTAIFNLSDSQISEKKIIISLIVGFLLILFTLYILINITRIGQVLYAYEQILYNLRLLLYEGNIPEKLIVRNFLKKDRKGYFVRIQNSAEVLLKLTIFFDKHLTRICNYRFLESYDKLWQNRCFDYFYFNFHY